MKIPTYSHHITYTITIGYLGTQMSQQLRQVQISYLFLVLSFIISQTETAWTGLYTCRDVSSDNPSIIDSGLYSSKKETFLSEVPRLAKPSSTWFYSVSGSGSELQMWWYQRIHTSDHSQLTVNSWKWRSAKCVQSHPKDNIFF